MSKIEVLLLYGGKSGEHEVSCRSAASICRNIDYELFSLKLCGVSKSNRWFLQPDSVLSEAMSGTTVVRIEESAELELHGVPGAGLHTAAGTPVQPAIVFPLIHGTFGEDGSLQGYLETLGLEYAGSRVFSSAACFDKRMTKKLCEAAGIPCTEYATVHIDNRRTDTWIPSVAREVEHRWPGRAIFVKPARSGSSVGVTRVEPGESLLDALTAAGMYDHDILLEPEIRGRELECAVTGNRDIRAHAVGEIRPVHGFYDYRAKYVNESGAALTIPAAIDPSVYEQVRELAADAYRACECSGFARVDVFYDEVDRRVVLNEINTIPGFTSISMFPSLCREDGIEYGALISRLIDLGLECGADKTSIRFDYTEW
ncbi:MAG: D-alanine--D-alanine ligase family protein [Spirochaetota bacterium]